MKKPLIFVIALLLVGCYRQVNKQEKVIHLGPAAGTFAYDLRFLQRYTDVIVLGGEGSGPKVLVVTNYQGRVMTSTTSGDSGRSHGWINYELIRSGDIPQHIYPVGGEDRFWLGPEGGQYSVFFQKDSAFDFENWQTPSIIDTEPFDIISSDDTQASFEKSAFVTNYAGFTFHFDIQRTIKMIPPEQLENELGVSLGAIKSVAFESVNSITNTGDEPWNKETGLLSIWILGMLTPSDSTLLAIPYEQSKGAEQKVTDNYFGTIPTERISKADGLLLLKADGKFRSKVGIAPSIAKNIAGSYDPARHVLTLVKYDLDRDADYVNSKWELQKNPYGGDVVNAYNDGPLEDGGQMGPFYELESSSPAKALAPGETLSHRHLTVHFEGDLASLDEIAKKTLGVSLERIK